MSVNVKGNPLVIALIICLVFTSIFLLVNSNESSKDNVEKVEQAHNDKEVPYDTNNETISSLTGYVTNVENKSKLLEDELRAVKGTLSDENIERIVSNILANHSNEKVDIAQITHNVTEALKKTIVDEVNKGKEVAANQVNNIDQELANWMDFKVGDNNPRNNNLGADNTSNPNNPKSNQGAWVMPMGYEHIGTDNVGDWASNVLGKTTSQFDRAFDSIHGSKSTVSKGATTNPDTREKVISSLVPYGTLHADSMLFGATALNSLFGRFERKSKVTDAYEFTVMVSGDTLMANGFQFPNIANAMASGFAVGDRALKCVRGDITSFTFVFDDGRIFQQTAQDKTKPLAKIGDEWGNLCVRGVIVDDVASYVAMQATISGLSKYSELIAQQQSTITATNTTMLNTLTGSGSKQAVGSIASGGLDSVAAVLAERYDSYYDGVYVMPGATLSLRLSENINIDYDPNGRFVSYEQSNSKAVDHYSFD